MTAPDFPLAPVILHIGLHKTGSTALQDRLRRGRAILADHAQVLLRGDPVLKPLAKAALEYHGKRVRQGDSEAPRQALLDAGADILARTVPDQRAIVISNESLCGHIIGKHENWDVFPVIGDLGFLLKQAFVPRQVHFVVYTRAFPSWIESAYNQTVKTDRVTLSRADFMAQVPAGASLSDAVARLRHAVGGESVSEIALEEEAAAPLGLGAGVLQKAGVPGEVIAALPPARPQNPSLPAAALDVMLKLNRSPLPGRKLRQVQRAISAYPSVFDDRDKRKRIEP